MGKRRLPASLILRAGGKRAGNSHDRRRVPPASKQRELARRWTRRAHDRRQHLLRFEAHDTWTAHIFGTVYEVSYSIEGEEFRHDVGEVRSPWALKQVLLREPAAMLPAHGSMVVNSDHLCWRAHSYGLHATMHNTVNLVWVHVVAGTSGEADRPPEPFKVTGRKAAVRTTATRRG